MVTKKDLSEALDEQEKLLEEAADALSDPELSDRQARVEALDILGFDVPDFLDDGEDE